MELTPIQKEHYDAIEKDMTPAKQIGREHTIVKIERLATACAKITEREKLKFAIEQLNIVAEQMENLQELNRLQAKRRKLQQQLKELEG